MRYPMLAAVSGVAVLVAFYSGSAVAGGPFGMPGVGAVVGGAVGHMLLHGLPRGGGGPPSSRSHRRHGDGNAERTPAEKPDKSPSSNVLLARAASDTVFKSMVVGKGLGAIGVEEQEIDTSRSDLVRDGQRDYASAIAKLLRSIDEAAKANSRSGSSSLAQGDVTQHALDRAVSNAYQQAHLATFEQFVGEQWTNERLRVAILDKAEAEIPGLLNGNNFFKVEMAPIEDIIQRAAKAIYKRTFETSELIAVNQATAHFTRALYELHGPLQSGDIREGVDDMLLAASRAALADYDERFVRSAYGVVMRYRAERILVDCLSANVEEIAKAEDQKDSKNQMVAKVTELAAGECRQWVLNAIGGPAVPDSTAGDDAQGLKPMPIRAVWIAPGVPKTDASMFGRVTSNQ